MHHDVSVRRATESDARGIAHVLVDGWQTTYAGILPPGFLAAFNEDSHEANTRALLRTLPDAAVALVAVDRGTVVGVALVREAFEAEGAFGAELEALYVVSTSQRLGIGSRLLGRVVAWAVARGIRSIRVWVFRENPFRIFYDRLGAQLLPQERHDDFGGATVTSVSYGWRDFPGLTRLLDSTIRSGSEPPGI